MSDSRPHNERSQLSNFCWDAWTFAEALFVHYKTLLSGGVVIVAIGQYERWAGHSIRSEIYWILALALLLMAAFLSWRDQRAKKNDAEAELGRNKSELEQLKESETNTMPSVSGLLNRVFIDNVMLFEGNRSTTDHSIPGQTAYRHGPHYRPATKNTVTMIFPRPVLLTLNPQERLLFERERMDFAAGIQEVPRSLAGHPYLKANGVERSKSSSDECSHLVLDLELVNTGLIATIVRNIELSIVIEERSYKGEFIPDVTGCYIEKDLIPGEKASKMRIDSPSIDLEITAQNPLTRAIPRRCWAHFLFYDLPPKDYKAITIDLKYTDGVGTRCHMTYLRDIERMIVKSDYQ